MQGDVCAYSDLFPWAMLAVVLTLVAFIIFYKEDPWEQAKRIHIYKIQQRHDSGCRCDDLDKLIAAEMNSVVVNV
jgi:hypothetical protein